MEWFGGRCGLRKIRCTGVVVQQRSIVTMTDGCCRLNPRSFSSRCSPMVHRRLPISQLRKKKHVHNGKRDMRRLLDRVTRPLVVPRGDDEGAKALVEAEWLVT